jgi:hypothetical protein
MKKKILVALVHYNPAMISSLEECLNAYTAFTDYEVTIHLFLTKECVLSNYSKKLNIVRHFRPANLGLWFEHEFKDVFWRYRHDYDYYIFAEDDICITKENFDKWVETQAKLRFPYVCGLLRYELKGVDGYKYLIDTHPMNSFNTGRPLRSALFYKLDSGDYIEPCNPHQASHIIDRPMMDYLIADHQHYFDPAISYVGVLEGIATDIYYNCDFVKVIPVNGIEKLLVHHLPNKYVNKSPHVYNKGSVPNEIKIVDKKWKMTWFAKLVIGLIRVRLYFTNPVNKVRP